MKKNTFQNTILRDWECVLVQCMDFKRIKIHIVTKETWQENMLQQLYVTTQHNNTNIEEKISL